MTLDALDTTLILCGVAMVVPYFIGMFRQDFQFCSWMALGIAQAMGVSGLINYAQGDWVDAAAGLIIGGLYLKRYIEFRGLS